MKNIKYMKNTLFFIPILIIGCANKDPIIPQEPIIITKIVEKDTPVYCNMPDIIKPDYTKGNRAQRLYMSVQYTKELELANKACKKDIQ